MSSDNQYCKPVVTALDALCPVITKIVNLSLQSGCFPYTFKSAIVKPLIAFDKEAHSGPRTFSRPTRPYKECHSTETALLKVKDYIMRSIDRGCAVVLVHLDLSAAFDTVNYSMLCDMLRSRPGVTGTVLKWIQSYLHQRTQTVSIGQAFSEVLLLLFGVPQGSLLGPTPFYNICHATCRHCSEIWNLLSQLCRWHPIVHWVFTTNSTW